MGRGWGLLSTFCSSTFSAGERPRHHHAIADREQGRLDAWIVSHLPIDGTHRFGVRFVSGSIDDRPILEGVVEQDQTTGADECQACLVVPVVARLVGVDESKVERSRSAVADESRQRLARWDDAAAGPA